MQTIETEVPKTIESIKIHCLEFDLENPRLPSTVAKKRNQAAVLEWMLDRENVIDLMIAIGERDYFSGEALLVVPKETSNNECEQVYEVVEGNRRLAAVKLLSNPNLATVRKNAVKNAFDAAKHHPLILPVLKFPGRDEILNYLGYRHITGVQPWDSLAKARYLQQLLGNSEIQNLNEKQVSLAKTIGSSVSYVKRLLAGVALYDEIEKNDFFNIKGLNEETIEFGVLTTAMQYSNIADHLSLKVDDYPALNIDKDNLEELTKWIFNKEEGKSRLGESRNLKYLSAVVANDKALTAFRQGKPLEQAAMLTEVPTNIFRKAVKEAKSRLMLANQYFHEAEDLNQIDAGELQEISKISNNMRSLIISQLTKPEEE